MPNTPEYASGILLVMARDGMSTRVRQFGSRVDFGSNLKWQAISEAWVAKKPCLSRTGMPYSTLHGSWAVGVPGVGKKVAAKAS